MTTLLVPFQFARNGRAAVTDDARSIAEQQIVDILVTSGMERVMRPEYGASVARHLFDPINDLVLADTAQEAMTRMRNLSVATVTDIRVVTSDSAYRSAGSSPSTVEILVTYRLPASTTDLTLRQPITNYVTEETNL